MAYLKKSDVLKSIKRRVQKSGDTQYTIFEAYLGVDSLSGKPVRKAAKDREKLESDIADFYKRLSAGGESAVLLNARESADARNALELLESAASTLTLTDCVRRILDSIDREPRCTTTVGAAFANYTKEQESKSKGQQNTVRSRVGSWVARFGGERLLSDVTAKEVAKDLEKTYLKVVNEKTKTTYNGCLGYIKTFLAWCAKDAQGYIAKNPIEGLELKTKAYVKPEYMTSADVEKLFRVLERRGGPDLANAILSFFCGVRQCEIARFSKGPKAVEIDLDEGYITIFEVKGHLRGIMPRSFTIPTQALAWMKSMPDFVAAARTPNRKFRDGLRSAAKEADVALPENAGRHTFCTMFEAAHHDSNALSAIVGNSEDVRKHHYNGVAKPQDGRAYFTILPSSYRST